MKNLMRILSSAAIVGTLFISGCEQNRPEQSGVVVDQGRVYVNLPKDEFGNATMKVKTAYDQKLRNNHAEEKVTIGMNYPGGMSYEILIEEQYAKGLSTNFLQLGNTTIKVVKDGYFGRAEE